MQEKGRIRATVRDAGRRARRAIEEARRQVADSSGKRSDIDVASGTNIISDSNVGQDGAAQGASAEQTVAIRQSGPERQDGDEG